MNEIVISEGDREALDVMLKGFSSAEDLIQQQMEPMRRVAGVIGEARETLLETYGVQPAGRCEHCDKLLFVGEMGAHIGGDEYDLVYCAEHAPSYADLKEFWDRVEVFDQTEDEREAREDVEEMVAAHLAAGGALTDRRLVVLDQ